MCKKGFTIVELAIVLVVIGIILSMAVKGKALVDAAKLKRYIAQFHKYEAAASTYYALTGDLPPVVSGVSHVGTNAYINKGLLTTRDLKDEYSKQTTWSFHRCGHGDSEFTKHWFKSSAMGPNICAVPSSSLYGISLCLMQAHLDGEYYEWPYTSKPDDTGSVRVWEEDSIINYSPSAAGKDCFNEDWATMSHENTGFWFAFRAF